MRISERLMYSLGVLLCVLYYFQIQQINTVCLSQGKFYNQILVVLILLDFAWGGYHEGIRMPQWIFMFTFSVLAICVVLDIHSIVIECVYAFTLAVILINVMIYGDANFAELKMVGQFQVGHQDLYTTKSGIGVSCYYPMDKNEYEQNIKKRKRNSKWLRYGRQSVKGMTRATADIGSLDHPPFWFFYYLKKIRMDCCQDGKLAQVFDRYSQTSPLTSSLLQGPQSSEIKQLIPIIFLHGLAGSRTSQSGSCRDLASHGYIVFSIDHNDGSAHYTRKKDGSEMYWPLDQEILDVNYRIKQLEIREAEVKELIDEVSKPKFLQDQLGFGQIASMDMRKLILGGHSFGGMTAIQVAAKDLRIKSVFTFDPWMYARKDDIMAGTMSLTQPQIHILTEGFGPTVEQYFNYSTDKVLNTLLENSTSPHQQLITLLDCNHYHQTDAICIVPLEVCIKSNNTPHTNVGDIYLLNTQAVMLFFSDLHLSNSINYQKLSERVNSLKDKFLDYRIKPEKIQEISYETPADSFGKI